MPPHKIPVPLCIVLAFCFAFTPATSSATVRQKAQQVKAASNMRQVILAFNVYVYSGARVRYAPDSLQSMEDFIRILAEKSDLTYADLFLSYHDSRHFEDRTPAVTGTRDREGNFEFKPGIMEFPIAFSVAVYPELPELSTKTPLLWTRDLHNYKNFEEPYSGHIGFLDGHVIYYEGEPGKPNPELEAIFGAESEFSKAIRILTHNPEGWSKKPLAPLPVRYSQATRVTLAQKTMGIAAFCAPALIAAFLVGLLPKPTIGKRILDASIAFGLVLIATLLFVPAVFC